jgi:hypothetical protein
MKAYFFALLVLVSSHAIAQDDDEVIKLPKDSGKKLSDITDNKSSVIAFYPGFWSPGIKFEQVSSQKVASYGIHARGYLFIFNGIKMEPFTRVYFKKDGPEGAFAQFKLSLGIYDMNSILFQGVQCYRTGSGATICPGNPSYVRKSDITYFAGGGVAFGYQFLLGAKKGFALDLFGGVQAIVPSRRFYREEELYLWLSRGFPIEFGIRLGKAF